ncbi:hypothetical protein EDB92DRAFT_1858671 [Lactarius akahatsu]|uniref:Uncharacterized protein n=1 Tax=Lactarius akahatsu TaxID=416441 RepID=A0AAD4LG97_9AGAM|nr:hypothetical protein EDB92DRAFT_1858671 [Lactarius akahatsu]
MTFPAVLSGLFTHVPSQGLLCLLYTGSLLRSWNIRATLSLPTTSLRYEVYTICACFFWSRSLGTDILLISTSQ